MNHPGVIYETSKCMDIRMSTGSGEAKLPKLSKLVQNFKGERLALGRLSKSDPRNVLCLQFDL